MTRNAELSSLYPEAVANIVHVTLKDGRTLTKRVDYPLGNAKNPVSDVELEGKFNASRRAGAGTGPFRKNFGPGLVARPAEWCASSDETIADAAMNKDRSFW